VRVKSIPGGHSTLARFSVPTCSDAKEEILRAISVLRQKKVGFRVAKFGGKPLLKQGGNTVLHPRRLLVCPRARKIWFVQLLSPRGRANIRRILRAYRPEGECTAFETHIEEPASETDQDILRAEDGLLAALIRIAPRSTGGHCRQERRTLSAASTALKAG
jgi:hypothetical protein